MRKDLPEFNLSLIHISWKDTIGAVKSINEGKKTLTINVEMFGRETPVELNFTEVKLSLIHI